MTGSWNEQSSQSKHLPGGIEVLGSCFLFCFVLFFLVATHGQIQDLVVFYQSYSHHFERCYPLSSFSSTAFCLFECIFHLGVLLNTEFGVHEQKVSIQELNVVFIYNASRRSLHYTLVSIMLFFACL